jgi:serine/threonine protein kinase
LLQFTQLVNSANIPQIIQPYSSELKHLTSNMLKHDPHQRISASDILNSNLIQNIMPKIPSQVEGTKIPEECFNLGKEALTKKK